MLKADIGALRSPHSSRRLMASDSRQLQRGIRRVEAGCNTCHAGAQHRLPIVIQRPITLPMSNQAFGTDGKSEQNLHARFSEGAFAISAAQWFCLSLADHNSGCRGSARCELQEAEGFGTVSRCVDGYRLELGSTCGRHLPRPARSASPESMEVDTTGGPWFGAPNGDPNFLAPGEVVLTFDDGPSPNDTREILAALAKECTKATFFVVGEMVALYPEIVKEVAEQGHTIGTHTWSHPNLARLSLPEVTQEIEATFNAAQKASPEPVAPFFRYPYLSSSKPAVDYLKSRNIGQFAVDIDSSDWRVRSSKAVIARVMAGLKKRGRGIILMHDIHKWTADAASGASG